MEKLRIERAFSLVCPATHAQKLAAAGKIKASDAARVTWRDRIGAIVTGEALAKAGVTIDDVREAVIHYTATEPTITSERIAGTALDGHFAAEKPGYLVIAAGYSAGPAA